MAKSYHIVFIEQNKSGSSALAARLLCRLSQNTIKASYAVLSEENLLPTAITISPYFLQDKNTAELNPTPLADLCQQAAKVDILIGLCLKDDGLYHRMKQSGMEKAFAMCAYWDLSHLDMSDPASFSAKLYDELQQRISLLVGAQY